MTNEWVLGTAYKIWCSADIKRKIHVTNVLSSDPDLEGLKLYEKFGVVRQQLELTKRLREQLPPKSGKSRSLSWTLLLRRTGLQNWKKTEKLC
jgi:hypothetical protein